MERSSIQIFKDLVHNLNTDPQHCNYTMQHVLALVKTSYQQDTSVHSGALLLFIMWQYIEEDQLKFIEFAKTFCSYDDEIMLKMMSESITKEELIAIKEKQHLEHYLNYCNETAAHLIYDETLYTPVFLPAYLIKNEVKYAHIRGEEDEGLICTFVSLAHANGYTKDVETCIKQAKDFYEYNKAGNTPIFESVEHFFVRPIILTKEDYENMEIFMEDKDKGKEDKKN